MAKAASKTSKKSSVEGSKATKNRTLIILSVLVVILVISNFWVYATFKEQVELASYLQLQVTDLTEIVELRKSTIVKGVNNITLGQGAGTYTSWTFEAEYAGYMKVNVHTSDTTDTYVRVRYNALSVVYDRSIIVGAGGIAVFPILPSNIEIRVGNTNLIDGANERLTITFHY